MLLESELPFGTWVAALTWAALFLASHWTGRFTRVAHDAQSFIAVENLSALHRGFEPKFILAQVLYAGIAFLFGLLLGGPGFVFFAGG
jgi:hypothetical protein